MESFPLARALPPNFRNEIGAGGKKELSLEPRYSTRRHSSTVSPYSLPKNQIQSCLWPVQLSMWVITISFRKNDTQAD